MYPNEMRSRQERLNGLIIKLSDFVFDEGDNRISQTIDEMRMLYKDGFRHNYSDFFPVILEIYKEDTRYSVDYLSNNLKTLQAFVETEFSKGNQQYDELYTRFIKLFDHLNLQISEINYFTMTEKKFNAATTGVDEALKQVGEAEKRLEESSQKIDEAENLLKESSKKVDEANKKAASIQTDLISILSIFAAIVLAVSGSISVLGNSIQAAVDADTTKLILIILICGMVLFNAIFFLIYLISRITGKELFVEECQERCKNVENKEKKCSFVRRVKRCMPCVFYYNILMIILILIDGIFMYVL